MAYQGERDEEQGGQNMRVGGETGTGSTFALSNLAT
jgi:hypothetical protein